MGIKYNMAKEALQSQIITEICNQTFSRKNIPINHICIIPEIVIINAVGAVISLSNNTALFKLYKIKIYFFFFQRTLLKQDL